ncbi:MAG: hypothetical protein FJ246_05830 [Nitrospira sp.]|nr:hypothetical protein [Nitrospira sp.]
MKQGRWRGWRTPALLGGVALVVAGGSAGCASTGDLDRVRQEAQASTQAVQTKLEAVKKQMAASEQLIQAGLAKEKMEYAALAKENDALRATVTKVTQALRDYLKAEQARYEEGLTRIKAAEQVLP